MLKIDVEGYETQFINELAKVNNLRHFEILIEAHPLGFNGVGNPQYIFDAMKKLNPAITNLAGQPVTSIVPENFTQLILKFG